jgi:chromosome segregation ATPase
MATPNKSVDISPCNAFSAKIAELTGYDVAYSKSLSGLVQQQQAAAANAADASKKMKLENDKLVMNVTNADNKLKLVMDKINSLKAERTQLEGQSKPFNEQRNALREEGRKLADQLDFPKRAIIETKKLIEVQQGGTANLRKQLDDAEKEKKRLEESLPALEAKKQEAEKQISPLQSNKTEAEKQKSIKDAELKDLENKLAIAKTKPIYGFSHLRNLIELNKLAPLVPAKKIEVASAALKVSNATMALGPISAQITQMNTNIVSAKSKIDEQTKLIAKLNLDLLPTTKEINKLKADLAQHTKIVDEIDAKIAANTAALAKIENDPKLKSLWMQGPAVAEKERQLEIEYRAAMVSKTVADKALADQSQLKTTGDGNSSSNAQFAKSKSDIDNKIANNKAELVKALKDKEDCVSKTSICGVAKKEIDDLKALLKQYEGELTALNTQYAKCNTAYENKCSAAQRGAETTLIAGRKTIENSLKTYYTDYDDKCKGKIDCDGLFSTFQEKKAIWNKEYAKQEALKLEHEICLDPTRNGCKDIYSAANINKATTGVNIDTLRRHEGFIQFRDFETADVTHSRILSNYKSVQNDYTKLKQNIQDLNNTNNNDNTKTSKYASKKQLYDNAIYTNILLTALTTSVLYYVFVEI